MVETPIAHRARIAASSAQSMWKYSLRSNTSVIPARRRGGRFLRVWILVVEAQLLVLRRRRQWFAVLLREERCEDVMRHRGGVRSVDAVLEEHDTGYFGVVARREEHEPAVVAQILA